jgi:transposase-like protein
MEEINQTTTFKVLEICLVFEKFAKPSLHPFFGVKTHHGDPFLRTFEFMIIIYII